MEEHGHITCKCDEEEALQPHTSFKEYLPAAVSFCMLAAGLAAEHLPAAGWFAGWIKVMWYAAAYIPVGLPVMREGWKLLLKKDFFTEYTLMTIATLGAFAIGDYAEGVAVMLFYTVGELLQNAALGRARRSIRSLAGLRLHTASVFRGGVYEEVDPADIYPGERLRVKAGERVALDGILLSAYGNFDASAITGESVPVTVGKGRQVLSGMVNLTGAVEIRAEKHYRDSTLARIMEMVEQAAERKARTEQTIRRLARIYTPAVFAMAVALALLPWFFVADYVFADWLYRALVFLVIACPCALVISVPLGYFGGIGAASRNGILFKGSNFLDVIARVKTVVMDKTGTITEGVFEVTEYHVDESPDYLAALAGTSSHPISRAIAAFTGESSMEVSDVEEIAGQGLRGKVEGREVLAGNGVLMHRYGVSYDPIADDIANTVVLCAVDGRYAGYLAISDRIKPDAAAAVREMYRNGVSLTVMLSGDNDAVTQLVAAEAGVDRAFGGLLPEDKVRHVEELRKETGHAVAFAGDGINDAPVLAVSDVGLAMGAMGSDVAIETADVVIQTDQPSKIVQAITIGRATRRVIWQNITMALGVKTVVLIAGAFGLASMWGAVFADVGVALLAILNAVRIQYMKFS